VSGLRQWAWRAVSVLQLLGIQIGVETLLRPRGQTVGIGRLTFSSMTVSPAPVFHWRLISSSYVTSLGGISCKLLGRQGRLVFFAGPLRPALERVHVGPLRPIDHVHRKLNGVLDLAAAVFFGD
jgi:hypothetical protein